MKKKFNKVAILALILLWGGAHAAQVYAADSSINWYDTSIKTNNIGNYQFEVNAYEKPFHETLPIIDKGYFPTTVAKFATEVDNTAPSATYKAKPVTKVDVVFAIGEFAETTKLESYIPSFESRLSGSSNHIDLKTIAVETVTGGFDMADADASTIYSFWDQYPNPNNYLLYGDYICNLYGRGGYQAFQNDGTNAFDQVFIESKSYDVNDFKMGFGIKLHGCGWASGAILHWDKDTDEAYLLLCSNSTGTLQLKYVDGMSGYIGRQYQPETIGVQIGSWSCSPKTAYPDYMAVSSGNYSNVTVSMQGNIMDIGIDGLTFNCVIPEKYYIEKGGLGLFAGCCVAYTEVSLSYETTVRKSLGESISDVSWRNEAIRFIIHVTDVIPYDMEDRNSSEYQYTITKVYNSNAYLINLGTSVNKNALDQLIRDITGLDGDTKGVFYYNIPISKSLENSSDYILSKVSNLEKPTSYILVDTDMIWETQYDDSERDLPLNFGNNTEDSLLANSWGVGLTHLYNGDKVMAEKWRYKHNPTHYDNSVITAGFSNTWIADPVNNFKNPGLYRVNYKRRDNPFDNAALSNPFDNYRYWSTDYDMRVKE